MVYEFVTDRLKLRQWRPEDYPIFAEMNADPIAMQYFPALLTTEESNELAMRIETLIAERGWGLWAVEVADQFIGFVGLHEPEGLPCSPCVEIGWRLARESWGHGYATEAANVVLKFAFETLNLAEIVSFTAVDNLRSQAVMQRINLKNTNKNFDHPRVPIGHPLREHVLYQISQRDYLSSNPS